MKQKNNIINIGIKYKKIPEEELLEVVNLAKNGDQIAYEKILSHMHNYLCHLTSKYYIQGSEFQDVYQEGAIKLLNVIDKFDKEKGSFTSFAQASIKKHIITMINRERAKKRWILNNSFSLDNTSKIDDEYINYIDNIDEDDMIAGSKVSNPIDIVQKDYEEYIIEKISEVLSDMEKKVFVLRFIKDYSYKEIALELNLFKKRRKNGKKVLDQKSVDNAIWRSRPKIKKVLEKLNLNTEINLKNKKKVKKNVKNPKI
jgi:RNA polymerase sporulation-specific sigma factor